MATSTKTTAASARPECIRLRGVRQNNLKGFDLDVPLGRYIVVTGLSGAGKSSLVFETLHAEGQRRYVETFSAYTRQFLELLNKPRVDSIENIRPSIAIEQTNTVRTSRSTVGTMTELTDYFKVWFSHVASCFDPATGERVDDDTPLTIWQKALDALGGNTVLLGFEVVKPGNIEWSEILKNLSGQTYARVLVPGAEGELGLTRIDALLAEGGARSATAATGHLGARIFVVQDRIALTAENRARFIEAAEQAMHFGQGQVRLFAAATADGNPNDEVRNPKSGGATAEAMGYREVGHYSKGLHSPKTGRTFRPATPGMFSFNSPLGACPRCRGFGRIIEIDYRQAIPDKTLSIDEGAIRCWEGEVYSESKADLKKFARRMGFRTDVPFASLTPEQQAFVIEGEPGYGEGGREWPKSWYGVKGFFRWLEKTTYKMHVRVFLSRYRAYNICPDCNGTRLQPEALCWRWQGRTIAELYQMPINELLKLVAPGPDGRNPRSATAAAAGRSDEIALEAILSRLKYLHEVGVEYLTLDRASKTLSGGEVQRVNLTGCLGTSLVDTLFVLDEPSVGLHPRDVDRLIAVIRMLTDAGNTVVVVEHDEAMIRAADHVIEIGPEPGAAGGHVVFQGSVAELLRSDASITGRYLSGRESVPVPAIRRGVGSAVGDRGYSGDPAGQAWLEFREVRKHNVDIASLRLPIGRFVCLSGVSGSGKSTLLDNVIHQGLLTARFQLTEDVAEIGSIAGGDAFSEVVMVDQSPLSRTPRSNAALYAGAWEEIRELFAATPVAQAAGYTASSFSFNSGDGRCEHCKGLGFERVEMQFLSDVFVPCPICEGNRFKPEILAISWNGRSVAETLALSVNEALGAFASEPTIVARLAPLASVGLGYLTLGQPLNTLSGGEAQRLKLVRYLGGIAGEAGDAEQEPTATTAAGRRKTAAAPETGRRLAPALLLLDEPTTGLHRHDVRRLLEVLHALVNRGHSVIAIEHNLDVLKSADWVIEIGPEAGARGGRIVAEGTPEDVARANTATSPFLRQALAPETGGDARLLVAEPAEPIAHPACVTVTGAREHNLKNISCCIPHHELTVVTGVSGSGKSTLAFDIVFAEGQRRFMESMSPYARQFVEQLPRPAVDRLTGIPPTVAIEQRVTRGSRKSTVATITEVAQYLRLLYARIGVQHHPESDRVVRPLTARELETLLSRVLASRDARRSKALNLCAPVVRGRKGHHQPIANWAAKQGYAKLRVDGEIVAVKDFEKLDRYKEHSIEVVVADLKSGTFAKGYEMEALKTALRLGKGSCFLTGRGDAVLAWFSDTRSDAETGESFPELDPKSFSFNSPAGWCPTCRGHGRIFGWMLEVAEEDDEDAVAARLREYGVESADDVAEAGEPCPDCGGARLNRTARAVKLHFRRGRPPLSLPGLLDSTPARLLDHLQNLELDARSRAIVQDIIPQIAERLAFLGQVGLGYLSMDRPTETLSGGEAQRIRLAAQLGSNLSGVLYVLDEPSIGLHARDNQQLIATLERLRDKGNTLLVVEHDDELMERANLLLDLGPAAGVHGGQIIAQGTPADVKRDSRSLTGLFLGRGIAHPIRGAYRLVDKPPRLLGRLRRPRKGESAPHGWLKLEGARFRNLKGFDLRLPLGRLIMVAGPSGAGKSTLFRDLLGPALKCSIDKRSASVSRRDFQPGGDTGAFRKLSRTPGTDFKAVIEVDQAPIGRTPRSTPATYLGIFDLIRQFFASIPEAKIRGYTASRFSFNVPGGRCTTCEGAGRVKLEMAFMPETYLPCEDCGGSRYSAEMKEISWKGRNIGDVLQLTFEEAAGFFDFHSQLSQVCRLMVDCGLGYLTLGQSSPTLSGGEAQRLKLVTELSQGLASYRERSRGELPRNFYILEEPTIGLHLSDCEKLIHVLHSLVDQGHTVVVIEHHLDLLAEADYLVELGPEGGPGGGELMYQGPVAGLLKIRRSPTAPFLEAKLRGSGAEPPRKAARGKR